MTDFLTRLAARALGLVPVAEPLIPSLFAPGPEIAHAPAPPGAAAAEETHTADPRRVLANPRDGTPASAPPIASPVVEEPAFDKGGAGPLPAARRDDSAAASDRGPVPPPGAWLAGTKLATEELRSRNAGRGLAEAERPAERPRPVPKTSGRPSQEAESGRDVAAPVSSPTGSLAAARVAGAPSAPLTGDPTASSEAQRSARAEPSGHAAARVIETPRRDAQPAPLLERAPSLLRQVADVPERETAPANAPEGRPALQRAVSTDVAGRQRASHAAELPLGTLPDPAPLSARPAAAMGPRVHRDRMVGERGWFEASAAETPALVGPAEPGLEDVRIEIGTLMVRLPEQGREPHPRRSEPVRALEAYLDRRRG